MIISGRGFFPITNLCFATAPNIQTYVVIKLIQSDYGSTNPESFKIKILLA